MTIWRWPEFFSACNYLEKVNAEQEKQLKKQQTGARGGSYVGSLREVGYLKNGD
jgi:hypothetical protein